jgi:hypothetical protein
MFESREWGLLTFGDSTAKCEAVRVLEVRKKRCFLADLAVIFK